ncbi:mannosyl-oligosaccharide alpha-1,2-mannosidase precursor [Ophiocordyceps camponoti-floridani]|uniref:alpha-1,2-Mannosidase n=1 Tax=Ophiocordyceps camponoti-floridani TaxID=2030778 RepID=A0A8H4VH65_9HYPO|nr:mannosyl-oligosaccharide alpha-1,2-mannosidase precursor [Ophiocordyceps camponoti-floridani]
MRITIGPLLLLGLAKATLAARVPPPLSRDYIRAKPVADAPKAAAVKEAFQVAWNGYRQYALNHDTLRPVSNGFEDDRNGWGATVVDGLSTAVVMGHTDIVNQMLRLIARIDFTTTKAPNDRVSLFETNIRYLGGLLAGYDLLTGPMKNLQVDRSLVDNLLRQAETLANVLSFAFDTPSGVPDPGLYLNPTRRLSGSMDNNLAEAGTLVLEWTRLSDLTGNQTYAKLAHKAELHLLHPRGSPEPWPGLVGSTISLSDGTFVNSAGGWSGGTDSFYEYLIKMYQYDPRTYGFYRDRWVLAAQSTMAHLASHPTTRPDVTYLMQYSSTRTEPISSHLASFAGGNFILGGVILNNDAFARFGLELAESYYNNYRQEAAGIGPEVFQWATQDKGSSQPPASQKSFYSKAGFWTVQGSYILRPETLESIYYAYRLTGDVKWQQMAWTAFRNISVKCRIGSGYGELQNVMEANGGGFFDQMQSFFLAETLKYLYLIFAPDSEVQLSLQNGDRSQFVFNTEAHPLRIRRR